MTDLFGMTEAPKHGLSIISLWQPWASLVAIGWKDLETRSFSAPARLIGQRIGIHAAKRVLTAEQRHALDDRMPPSMRVQPEHSRLPRGVLLCTAILASSHVVRSVDDRRVVLSDGRIIEDDGFGDYAIGRWCWKLRDVEALATPIPMVGRQGWWTCSEPAR